MKFGEGKKIEGDRVDSWQRLAFFSSSALTAVLVSLTNNEAHMISLSTKQWLLQFDTSNLLYRSL